MTDKATNQEIRLELAQLTASGAYLRPKNAAAYLGISRRHFASLVSRGLFASIPVGRRCVLFSRGDLDAGLARLRRPAVGESKR